MHLKTDKLWGTINDEIEIRSLNRININEALDVLDKSFFLNESVSIGSEINLPENGQARQELRKLCRITAEDGVSLVAIHKESKKVVGVAFNKIQYKLEGNEEPFFIKFRNNEVKSPQAQCLMDFMIKMDSGFDVFDQFQINAVCELMFLATLPEWERRSIGRTLTRYTLEMTQFLSKGVCIDGINPELRIIRPQAVTAIFTSTYSQKIGESHGFTVLNTVPYTLFNFNDKTFAERIGTVHPNCQQVIKLFTK